MCFVLTKAVMQYTLRNRAAHSRTQSRRGKAKHISYSECVSVALGNQRAKGMRNIVIGGLLDPRYFSKSYQIGQDFRETLQNTKRVF